MQKLLISFFLFSLLFSSEENRGIVLPKDMSQGYIGRLTNQIDDAYKIDGSIKIVEIFERLKKQASDESLLRILDISISLVKTLKKENFKEVLKYCTTLEKLEQDKEFVEQLQIIKNELGELINFEFIDDIAALILSFLEKHAFYCRLNVKKDTVFDMQWSEDNSQLTAFFQSKGIKKWNINSAKLAAEKDSEGLVSPTLELSVKHGGEWQGCIPFKYVGKVFITNLDTNQPLHNFNINCAVKFMQWSRSGKKLALVSHGNGIWLWQGYKKLKVLTPHDIDYAVFKIKWSSDDNFLATISEEGIARLWDINERQHRIIKHNQSIYNLEWSPDNQYIAVSSSIAKSSLRAIDSKSFETIFLVEDLYVIYAIAWSRDGSKIAATASASWDPSYGVQVFNLAGEHLFSINLGLSDLGVNLLSWAPDDKYIAVCEKNWADKNSHEIKVYRRNY